MLGPHPPTPSQPSPAPPGSDPRAVPVVHTWRRDDGYELSTDRARIDVAVVHGFLQRSYWAAGIPMETLRRAMDGSLCYGLYAPDGRLVGFARLVTDGATFAWLCDVFIDESVRGIGLSKWMLECLLGTPGLGNLRRWLLATRDAQTLYTRFGFTEVPHGRFLEIRHPDPYGAKGG